MKSFEALFAKSDKREPKTIRKIAFCGWDFAKSKTLCFAEENDGLWNPRIQKKFAFLAPDPARPGLSTPTTFF